MAPGSWALIVFFFWEGEGGGGAGFGGWGFLGPQRYVAIVRGSWVSILGSREKCTCIPGCCRVVLGSVELIGRAGGLLRCLLKVLHDPKCLIP